ncbi:MAG: hypothetical protein ACPGQR_04105 [Marinirhabdus sp.]
MITADLRHCSNLINKVKTNEHCYRPKESDLGQSLNNVALSVQNNLPYELLNIGRSGTGADFQSSYTKKPTSGLVKALVAPTGFMSDPYLAWDLGFTLKAGIYAGAYWETAISQSDASFYAQQFVNQFMTGQGQDWYDDGGLSNVIKNSPEGQSLIKQISDDFREEMLSNQGDFSKIKLNDRVYSTLNFSWKSSPTLKILVGGTQELTVTLSAIFYNAKTCKWLALISVEIRDDFGVTESDITNASPSAKLGIGGLTDMWVLQHQRGYKPFTTVFNFSFFCYDNH